MLKDWWIIWSSNWTQQHFTFPKAEQSDLWKHQSTFTSIYHHISPKSPFFRNKLEHLYHLPYPKIVSLLILRHQTTNINGPLHLFAAHGLFTLLPKTPNINFCTQYINYSVIFHKIIPAKHKFNLNVIIYHQL